MCLHILKDATAVLSMRINFNVEILGAVASICTIYFGNSISVVSLWEHCLFSSDPRLGLSLHLDVASALELSSLVKCKDVMAGSVVCMLLSGERGPCPISALATAVAGAWA